MRGVDWHRPEPLAYGDPEAGGAAMTDALATEAMRLRELRDGGREQTA